MPPPPAAYLSEGGGARDRRVIGLLGLPGGGQNRLLAARARLGPVAGAGKKGDLRKKGDLVGT